MEILAGIVLIVLGIAAIALPLATSLGAAFLVACAFGVAGIVHLFRALEFRGFGSFALQALVGVLYLVIAAAIVRHPLWSVVTLALVVSATLITEGVFALAAYFALGDTRGSLWILLSAMVTLALGFIAWSASIVSSPLIVSALVGANLIASGGSRLLAAYDERRVMRA